LFCSASAFGAAQNSSTATTIARKIGRLMRRVPHPS
jgi:hypothetical protein